MSLPKGGREFFYFENHQRNDADLHDAILSAGDQMTAHEVSRAVMQRHGLSEDQITRLMNRKIGEKK